MKLRLRHMSGPHANLSFELGDGALLIGRGEDCDLRLESEQISRHHARLTKQDSGYVIADLESTNGVRVNGEQISGPRSLFMGDRLGIGDHLLLLTDDQAIVPTPVLGAIKQEVAQRRQARQAHWRVMVLGAVLLVLALLVGLVVWREVQAVKRRAATMAEPVQPLVPPKPPAPTTVPSAAPDAAAPGDAPADAPEDTGEPAAQAEPPRPTRNYLHLLSQPAGASISLNGQPHGTTPALLPDLPNGDYDLRLTLPGYRDLSRSIILPGDRAPGLLRLEQLRGTAIITSQPPGMVVLHQRRFLGLTPHLVTDLPVGDYDFNLLGVGFEPATVTVKLVDYQGRAYHQDMKPNTVGLSVVTLPAGAEVLLDEVSKGASPAATSPGAASATWRFDGLRPGRHKLQARVGEQLSEAKTVTLSVEAPTTVTLVVWQPNVTVTLNSGKSATGMLRERLADGGLLLLIAPDREVRLPADQVKSVSSL